MQIRSYTTVANMAHIHDNEGFFIAPAPMYETYKMALYKALDTHDCEQLVPYKSQINRGFEVPLTIIDEENENKEYQFRMIILYAQGVSERKRNTLLSRVNRTRSAFS